MVSRLRALMFRRRLDQDFADEMAAHLAMAVDDYVKRGLSPEQARTAALLRLGNRASLMEQQRELQGIPLVETAWRDLHLAVRMLRRAPAFAATTILTLAVGIG